MKRLNCILGLCAVLSVPPQLNAAILVGTNGVGPMSFSTNPIVSEFSTSVLNGVRETFRLASEIDAVVAQFNFHIYSPAFRQLPTSMTLPPSGSSAGFRFNNNTDGGLFLQSLPVTDSTNAANMLVGRFVNASGTDRTEIILSYDFTAYGAGGSTELVGFYVYFSHTGVPGTWVPIPALTADESTGQKVATLDLGNWSQGAPLFVLWVDDNNVGAGGDPAYTIDNFRIGLNQPPAVILSHPGNVTNLMSRSVRLEVVAGGVGLTYQWHKVGVGPINPAFNPSAATATLVITSAQLSDTGDYYVVVTNPGGSVSSLNARIQINPDIYPPKLLAAGLSNLGSNLFNLAVDEPVCIDALACGANATCTYNWQIVPIMNGIEGFDLIVEDVLVNGTNLVFRTSTPHQAGQQYRIRVVGGCDGGINDVFGNQLVAGEPGSTIDVPFPLPRLSIAASGSNAVVSWPADSSWVLQRANTVNGPYATVDPTSGFGVHTNATAGNPTNLFFRLRYQP